jgi:hypothetical protein
VSVTDDLLRRIRAFTRARDKQEKLAGVSLWDLYEEARVQTLEDLIARWGHLEKYELQHVEQTLAEIERIMRPYTNRSVQLRLDNIAAAWQVGQDLVYNALTLDAGLAPAVSTLAVRLGVVDQGMVSALFGHIPELAGKVQADVLLRIRNELVVSAIRGESIPKMAARISGTGLTQEGLKRPFRSLKARGNLIARTETIKAADAGYEDLASRAQSVIQETLYDLWLTAGDERVESECRAIARGDAFGAVAGYPGVYRRGEGPRPVLSTHPG